MIIKINYHYYSNNNTMNNGVKGYMYSLLVFPNIHFDNFTKLPKSSSKNDIFHHLHIF